MLTAAEGTERDRKRFGSVGVAHQMSQCFPPPSLCSPDCRLKGSPRGSRGQSCGGQGEFVGGARLTGRRLRDPPRLQSNGLPRPPTLQRVRQRLRSELPFAATERNILIKPLTTLLQGREIWKHQEIKL